IVRAKRAKNRKKRAKVADEVGVRPATLRDLIALTKAFSWHEVPYMLIGGFAMIAHGFSRATRDIDILFLNDVATGKQVVEVLFRQGQLLASNIDPDWFEQGQNIRLSDRHVLDIMLNANGETYKSL